MRKYYLDNLRWGVGILVVLYHVLYMYNSVGVLGGLGNITGLKLQYWDLFLYIVYPWFMPLLFIVSGVSSRYYLERHTDREFIKSRTTRLLVPSTIGLFAFQFIQGYISMALGGAFEELSPVPGPVKFLIMAVSGIGVLWYVQLLWVFSLLLVLVKKLEKDRLRELGGRVNMAFLLLMTIAVWASAQVLNTPVIVVYRFGLYGLMFFMGYFVFSCEGLVALLKSRALPLLAAAAALGTAFCVRYFGQNYADAPVNRTPLFTAYCWIGCLGIFGFAARYLDFRNGFTDWMKERSFGLYVFHYLGISAAALFIGKPGILPAPIVYLLSLIVGFAAGYLLNAVISRLPFFRWAVLGIRKRK